MAFCQVRHALSRRIGVIAPIRRSVAPRRCSRSSHAADTARELALGTLVADASRTIMPMKHVVYRILPTCAALALAACGADLATDGPGEPPEDLREARQPAQTAQGRTAQGRTAQGRTAQGATAAGGWPVKVMTSGATVTVNGVTYPVSHFAWKDGKISGSYSVRRGSRLLPLPDDGVGVSFKVQPIDGLGPEETLRVVSKVTDTNEANLMASCAHRTNPEDVHLYRVQWFDSEDGRGAWKDVCDAPGGDAVGSGRAVFTKGYWKKLPAAPGVTPKTAYEDEDPQAFGLACWDGVAAKCVRWGYKEWQTLTSPRTGEPVEMRSLFIACQRAAMADYCGTGESFTQEDTPIDIWDAHDFIRKSDESITWPMFAEESSFDDSRAVCIEASRYESLPWSCSGKCAHSDSGGLACPELTQNFAEPFIDRSTCGDAQLIFVDTGSGAYCPHSPATTEEDSHAIPPRAPRTMHRSCNSCTADVCASHPSCCGPVTTEGGGWTSACAQYARDMCLFVPAIPTVPTCRAEDTLSGQMGGAVGGAVLGSWLP
ncbi:ADYC domain-containing protein [Sorangium sp. So ce1389]|uniref:ADYC domain-containing protein n=1 Tax=Sorangium sp. So ce1389 TaxID=3133336 RepID=UPI003F625D90